MSPTKFTAYIFFKYQAALMSHYSQLGCTEELQFPNVVAKFTAAIFGANEYRDYAGALTQIWWWAQCPQ